MRSYAAMKAAIFLLLQYLLPQHLLSRLVGTLANCQSPKWLKNLAIRWFIKFHHVDLGIAEKTNANQFSSFNEFFTRHLRTGMRPIDSENVIVSPADGSISEIGQLQQQTILQAKNRVYSLTQLLANDNESIHTFTNGTFATIYLSPQDYHRVHMPYTGKLLKSIYVPGKLFSVSPITLKHIDAVFARNERLINIFMTDMGPMAVILVGAMLVSGIHTTWQKTVTPNHFKTIQSWDYTEQNIVLQKGEELGYFNFGSTVILLFPENKINWLSSLSTKSTVQYGRAISKIIGE